MSWVQHMRKALKDRREPVLRGIVEAVDGRVVQVRTPDGRLIPAAPLALVGGGKGVYQRYATGDDVVLLCDQGDPNGAVCLARPRTEGQDAPGEVDHEGLYIYEDRVEVRAAEGDDVQGVVMRPVLDGLYSALGAVSDLLDIMASPTTPPGTAVQNAALLNAVRTQIGLPAVGTSAVLSNVLGDLDTSRAGQGTGPYCSDVLRAVVDGPGGGGGGGASPGATLEDIDDAIQAHLTADHANLATDADIAALDARVDALEAGGAGVTSVNGESGVVILSAADVGADASGTALGLLASHVAASDPHTGYVLESREGAANGIATLNGSTLVPRAQLGSGGSGFLTYGGTWAVLVAGDVPDLSATYATVGHNHAGTYQPLDADLTALAATTTTDGHTWRRSGGTWAYGTLDHTALGSLAWTSSGHTGTNATLAGWSAGVPVEVATSTFAAASHVHAAGDITSGTLATARLGSGSATSATYLRGDSAWSALAAADIASGTLDEDRLPIHALIGPEAGFGSDGSVDFDGSATVTLRGNAMVPAASVYTLACDVHANALTIGNGVTIKLNGFVLRAHTLTIAASATVVIHDDGNTATGTSGAAAFSNTATTDRSNGAGATGRNTPGIGATASNLSSPAVGGAGGAGGAAGSAGGIGGTVAWTTANQNATGWPMDPHSLLSLRTINSLGWKGGAGGGAGAVGGAGGISGGGGAGGGFALVCVGSLTLGASASLTVRANGGNGGPASGAAAGGGGGGGGGCAILSRRRQQLGAGATVTVQASAGTGGALSGTGSTGVAGSAGRTFDLVP